MKKAQTEISRTFEAICAEAEARRQAVRQSPLPEIRIGLATCGIAAGALDTKQAFEQALAQRGLQARIVTTGCVGHCYAEPVVIIDHPDSGFPPIFYQQVTPGKANMLVRRFLEERGVEAEIVEAGEAWSSREAGRWGATP